MRRISMKAKVVAVGVAGASLALSGVAYAYWTTSGSGTGSAANASSNGTVTLSASWAASALYPGGSQTVTFYAANPGATDLYVGTVSLDPETPWTVDGDHSGCVLTDFSLPPVIQNQTVPHGTLVSAPITLDDTGTISFANDLVNSQNACKGATVTAHLVSN
jgi:hypothetical protein